LDEYKYVLEVGPGMGMLTQFLFELEGKEIHAVDADGDMVAYMNETYPDWNPEHLTHGDFLKQRLDTRFNQQQFALIGNFPYNISTQILFKLLDYRQYIPEMVGMFQREVAQRVAAKHNSKIYGIQSVLLQTFYDVEYLFTVKAGSFNPPPKVQSAVIRLSRKENVNLECSEKKLRMVVKATFGNRRKMIRNTMKPFLPQDVIKEKGSFFQQRPENLTYQDFIELTKLVETYHK
jgi:16S rRNA (adenine1518-N6/adenine1519-N6)-dimethyltransferase